MNSKFGSSFGADSAFGASSGLSTGAGSSGLHHYIAESERLAKAQAQDIGYGGVRAGGSQLADLSAGYGSNAGLSGGSAGGFKTKSWEKASKWSSQSEVRITLLR